MSLYWAKFVKYGSNLFRLDTRIYLQPIAKCGPGDQPIGAVVGKNPGSARPTDARTEALHELALANDKLLPTVRSIVSRAYSKAGIEPPDGGFVQVLNLFYLCDKGFGRAMRTIGRIPKPPSDKSEARHFPWIMYLWGEYDDAKAPYMVRFGRLDSDRHFYFDKNRDRIAPSVPTRGSFAKHTQGMVLEPVIKHLASLIETG